MINSPDDIEPAWLDGIERIGITSGASTPERLVDQVVTRLQPHKVTEFEIVEEDVTFLLPKDLR